MRLLGLVLTALAALPLGAASYDVILAGGRVLDGAGNPWFLADVAIRDGRIAAIGNLVADSARLRLDVRGLAVAPGFVDIHSHGDRGLAATPTAENYLRQGVTTVFGGQDGGGALPLAKTLAGQSAIPISINIGYFAGHGSIRARVMGTENRGATREEIEQMKRLAEEAMRDGAFGLSTGLYYIPGNFAPVEEVIEIARVVGPLGGMHISHMRDEAGGILESVRECIRIGEEGRLPTQLTHHKIIGRANWGLSKETLRMVAEARARGVDVSIDQYPYTASSTGTAALFPQWAQAGGRKALLERLDAPEQLARIKAEIVRRIRDERGGGDPGNVVLASCPFDQSLDGKSLADLCRERGLEASIENAAVVAVEIQRKGGCSAVYHAIGEEDVERILASPYTMIASDGGIPVFGEGVPHPRNYGAFARVLGRYVRERGVVTLEEAVRKMTSMPASRAGLFDRGVLRVGLAADIAVFDPASIADRADFARPHQYSEGVKHVFVNGKPVLLDGKVTSERPGQVLRGPAWRENSQ